MPKIPKPDFAQNALRVVEQSIGEKLAHKSQIPEPQKLRIEKKKSRKIGTPGKELNLRPPAGKS